MKTNETFELSTPSSLALVDQAAHIEVNMQRSVDPLYNNEEASRYLNRCKYSLLKDRKAGRLQAVRSGRKILFRQSSLDKFLQQENLITNG